jgi:hypothetical protein
MRSAAPPIKCARSPFRERTSPPRANPVRSHHSSVAPVEVFHPTGQGRRNTGANVCSGIEAPRSGAKGEVWAGALRPFRIDYAKIEAIGAAVEGGNSETTMTPTRSQQRDPWNKGCLIGQKCQLKSKDVRTIRIRLQLEERRRDLALFKSGNRRQAQRLRYPPAENRRCVCRREGAGSSDRGPEEDWSAGAGPDHRANTPAIGEWLAAVGGGKVQYLFPVRFRQPSHLSTAQYARIVHQWVECTGLNGSAYRALTHHVGTKRHRFTRRPATAIRCSCRSDTPHWKALSAISGSGGRCPRHLGTGPAIGERDGKGRAGEQAKHARLLGDG